MSQFVFCKSENDFRNNGGVLLSEMEDKNDFFHHAISETIGTTDFESIWCFEGFNEMLDMVPDNIFYQEKVFYDLLQIYYQSEWLLLWYADDWKDLDVVHNENELKEYLIKELSVFPAELYLRAIKGHDLNDNNVRVIKIGKEALFEFIYETFVENTEQYFDIDPIKVATQFDIDFGRGEFIACVYNFEDDEGKFVTLPEEIDTKKLMMNITDTTSTMFTDKRFVEYTKEELIELSKKI